MDRATKVYLQLGVRRAVVWVIVPAVLLLGFRLYWGYRAERRLAGTLEHLRAMHVRYRPEEFPDGDAVPADQNAVNALLAGPLGFKKVPAGVTLNGDPLEYQSAADREALLQYVTGQQELFDRIDLAASRPQIVWPRKVFDPKWRLNLAGVVGDRRLVGKAAIILHRQHDDVGALRHLARMLAEARILERSPVLLHVLLAGVEREIVADGVANIQADLDLRDPAAAAQARQVMEGLVDDERLWSGLTEGFEGILASEYVYSEKFTRFDVGGLEDSGWFLAPLREESWSRNLERWSVNIVAHRASSNELEFSKVSRPPAPPRSLMEEMVEYAGMHLAPVLARWEVIGRQVSGRAGALLLAARLYVPGQGRLPADAEAMVPGILKQVPVDPYRGDKGPLHYRLDVDGATVWSVGNNGKDDGGNRVLDVVFGAAHPPDVPPPPKPPTTRGRSGVATRGATTRAATSAGATTRGAATR